MSLFDLVMHVKDCRFEDAMKFLADRLGISCNSRYGFPKRTSSFVKQCQELSELTNYRQCSYQPPIYDETILNYFEDRYYTGWIDEGISPDVMKRFEIKWYEYRKHIIIPCRNAQGKLIGIRRRSLVEGEQKYMPLTIEGRDYAFSTGLALYGLYENLATIQHRRECYLFEGEKSVLKAATIYGDFPCVACFSHHISYYQTDLLIDLGVERVIICFDYDNAGEQERYAKLQQTLKSRGLDCSYLYPEYKYYLDEHDSPIDKGRDVFELLIRNRVKG